MGFYEQLSLYYDEIFPANAQELRFAAQLLEGRTRLLDMGCGTGNKTAVLAEGIREAEAFDSDPGMIAKAEAINARPNIRYRILDLMEVDRAFAPASFDAALCLGNTLVHLTQPGAIDAFLAKTAAILEPGGMFLLQILNYDDILDKKITTLPRIETDRASFSREYVWQGGIMHFVTELRIKESDQRLSNDIILVPLRRDALANGLAAAGFGIVEYYGNYTGEPYIDSSFHLIAKAIKA